MTVHFHVRDEKTNVAACALGDASAARYEYSSSLVIYFVLERQPVLVLQVSVVPVDTDTRTC